MDTTFLGAYVDFFNKPDFKLNFDSLGITFAWVVALLALSYWGLKNKKRVQFEKLTINKFPKLTLLKR